MSRILKYPLVIGSIAGFLATAPMTAVMKEIHRWPPREEQPLPPRQITMRLAKVVGVRKRLDKPAERTAATMASHFGYGALAGSLYEPFARSVPGHSAVKGAAFGVIVWTLSYLGWIPASGVLRPATQHPARRNALMIVAHLVWGAATGVLTEKMEQARQDEPGQDKANS